MNFTDFILRVESAETPDEKADTFRATTLIGHRGRKTEIPDPDDEEKIILPPNKETENRILTRFNRILEEVEMINSKIAKARASIARDKKERSLLQPEVDALMRDLEACKSGLVMRVGPLLMTLVTIGYDTVPYKTMVMGGEIKNADGNELTVPPIEDRVKTTMVAATAEILKKKKVKEALEIAEEIIDKVLSVLDEDFSKVEEEIRVLRGRQERFDVQYAKVETEAAANEGILHAAGRVMSQAWSKFKSAITNFRSKLRSVVSAQKSNVDRLEELVNQIKQMK